MQRYEGAIRDVILVAQGEMALEEFLKQIRETWLEYEVELVQYQNKTRLIKGWDDLFNKLKEHINSLAAMKLSPYFKVAFYAFLVTALHQTCLLEGGRAKIK